MSTMTTVLHRVRRLSGQVFHGTICLYAKFSAVFTVAAFSLIGLLRCCVVLCSKTRSARAAAILSLLSTAGWASSPLKVHPAGPRPVTPSPPASVPPPGPPPSPPPQSGGVVVVPCLDVAVPCRARGHQAAATTGRHAIFTVLTELKVLRLSHYWAFHA